MFSPDHVGPTSIGTGTTKTLLGGANLILPTWARSIVALIPNLTVDTPTATESVAAKLIVESDDLKITPLELLPAPIGAILGATTSVFIGKPERYLVNIPVEGGEQIKLYGEALVANAVAPLMGCTVIVSDQPPTGPQRFAKLGTVTSTGVTASTDVSGTVYQFTKAQKVVEFVGAVLPTTVAASDGICGNFRFESSEYAKATPAKFAFNPLPGNLSSLISTLIPGVSRMPVDIPVREGPVSIQDYLNMALAPGAAGNFVTGVIFEGR